ncbi:hypothetical protein C6P45_003570 [Maudiozyma exigua]|uniref:Amino acid permease/ SLC12A domain-containing protein n=1 Tax=Maudiozyma exigua TaxID=34358 RepID=A0A9P6WBK1_MAUEX|nr:hypothetical protein C6P45_003570 [Kazachstania exigua]
MSQTPPLYEEEEIIHLSQENGKWEEYKDKNHIYDLNDSVNTTAEPLPDNLANIDEEDPEGHIREDLQRALKPRHVSLISIAGIIGTGLYLSTSKSLATGGPASLFMNYTIMGIVVYLTMLSLGEMSTFMPISGSFVSYAKKFGSESFAMALMWNYWFNDAVSVASDLTALQLVMDYWKTSDKGFHIGQLRYFSGFWYYV